MNGLWQKDWLLLKKQALAGVLTLVLAIACLALFRGLGVPVAALLVTMMSAFLVQSTLTTDQQNHGLRFLLTLPLTRRQYVLEKFTLLLSVLVVAGVLVAVLAAGLNAWWRWHQSWLDIAFATFAVTVLVLVIVAITLAAQLKRGPAVAQIAMSLIGAIVAVLIGGCYAVVRFTPWGAERFTDLVAAYHQHGPWPFVVILLLVAMVVLWLTLQVSVKSLTNQEL